MLLTLHLWKVTHYLTSKGLGRFPLPQGNLDFAVKILMLKKYHSLQHGITQTRSASLSSALRLTRCRRAYLESHDAARMRRERPRSFSGGDAARLPAGCGGAGVVPVTSARSAAAPAAHTDRRHDWAAASAGKGRGGQGALSPRSFPLETRAPAIPLRIRLRAVIQKDSRAVCLAKGFLPCFNCDQPSYWYRSFPLPQSLPMPMFSQPGTSHPSAAALKNTWAIPRIPHTSGYTHKIHGECWFLIWSTKYKIKIN